MSLSEFEAAVSVKSAARHAYLDALQAVLPACEDGKARAIDKSDYDEAAMFSAIAKAIQSILAGIEKPVPKSDILAALDGGIFEAPHLEWQLEKSVIELDIDETSIELERHVQAASDNAARNTARIFDEERAAAHKDDFALAKQLKEAREESVLEGERAVNAVRMEGECALHELEVGCPSFDPTRSSDDVRHNSISQARLSDIILREPKPSAESFLLEQRARSIVSQTMQVSEQDIMSLSALLKPPQAAGYDASAFRAAGCDWSTIRTAGFTAAEAKAAGCDAAAAHAAGYNTPSLLSSYGYDAVAAAGCDVSGVLVSCTPSLLHSFTLLSKLKV
jgi:hypothetical protein